MGDCGFVMAADGWAQVCPLGEFLHAGAGVTQVVDAEACAAMAADFAARTVEPNFPGALVDFDHFSMDAGKPSEAAGWVAALEARDDGLWAKVRWTDAGLAAVTGGRYRLVSPVFPEPSACEDLGGGRIRPRRLVSAALTNEPNIKGGKPIANRAAEADGHGQARTDTDAEDGDHETHERHENGTPNVQGLENRARAKRYRWTLGAEAEGGHCPTCLERAGQVKTAREWAKMPATLCGKHCRCSLVEVGKGEGIENRWSDAARAASLAVRRAKAAARAAARETGGGGTSGSGTAAGAETAEPVEAPKKRAAVAAPWAVVAKGDLAGSVKARYTRLLSDLESAAGDPEKLRAAARRYLEGRYGDRTDFAQADIEAVRECLRRNKTLTDYQIRAAEDALAEAEAWVRGDSRGVLDAAEKEIAAKLTAAGIRFAEVEALRRLLNPLKYYAEYEMVAHPSALPDWIDDFAAHQDLTERYPFLRPGAKSETMRFGKTAQDRAMMKHGMMTRKDLKASLQRRAEAAARHDAYLPVARRTRAGNYVRGPARVDAEAVMYDLPPHLRKGTIGTSGWPKRLPVETEAVRIRVKPTRSPGVGKGAVAAALVPLAVDALMHSVPAARRSEAQRLLQRAANAGTLPEKPGFDAYLTTGMRLFFGDIGGAVRGLRFGSPVGSHEGEEEMAERYGRGKGTGNRGEGSGFGVQGGDGVGNRWSDEARAASLAVRRAKAAARNAGRVISDQSSVISESATQTEAGVRGGRAAVGTPLRGKPVVQPMPPGVRAPPGLREPPGSVPPTQPRRMPFIYPVPPKSEGTPARGGRMPDGFTPPSGPATQALVEWVNVKTGERWTAPSGGYTPPNEDWVPAGGGTVAPVQTTGPGKLRLGRDASPYPGFGGARAPGRMQPLRRDVEN